VIGRQCQRGGACSLPIDAIAALAGVGRTTVKNALRAAKTEGLVLVKERRIPGRKSLTNVVTVISRDWLGWLRVGRVGGKKTPTTEDKFRNGRESERLRRSLLGKRTRPDRPGRAFERVSAKFAPAGEP
jgi:Bacterial regulatory proteins, gntR family